MEQHGSQQMLQRLEQANLFVVSLDSKRQWYRYHALFAQALCYQLEQTQPDLLPSLHQRASLWYAQHDQTIQAIVHAFKAHQWQWAAELVECKSLSLMAFTWGASEHQLGTLQHWLKRLPIEAIGSRPRLCLACASLLWTVAPYPLLDTWLKAAEAGLNVSLATQIHANASHPLLTLQARQEQENCSGR
jgi:LuxR family maltose regulon positive regulatory protein